MMPFASQDASTNGITLLTSNVAAPFNHLYLGNAMVPLAMLLCHVMLTVVSYGAILTQMVSHYQNKMLYLISIVLT